MPSASATVATLHTWDSMPREKLSQNIERRFIHTDHVLLAQLFFTSGARVARHSHVNEQLSYVLSGKLRFIVGEREQERVSIVSAGEVLVLPSNVPHEVEVLEDTVDIDVFTPPREDWIHGTDAYLRR